MSRVHFVSLRSTYASDSLARARARVFESLIHVDTFRCAQLYDECNNNSGGRPTEVERLVKLGANGSGYKDPDVRLLSRLLSRLSLRLPLSLSFSFFLFLSLLLLPSEDNNVLTCPPFTRIPTPSSSSSSLMLSLIHI